MALTYTWYPPFPAPANFTAQLQDGGSLAANTTYYYRVMAMSGDHDVEGLPSVEISVTTTDTQRAVYLSWDTVPGAEAYAVFRRTASQVHYDFYGAHIYDTSVGGAWQSGTSTTNTHLLDNGGLSQYWGWPLWAFEGAATGGWHPPYWDSNLFPIQPPARGKLEIYADSGGGTVTFEGVKAAVGDYCYHSGNLFILLANLYIHDDGPVVWDIDKACVYLAGYVYLVHANAGTSITYTDSMLWLCGGTTQTVGTNHECHNFICTKVFGARNRWTSTEGLVMNASAAIYSSTTADNADFSSCNTDLRETNDAITYTTARNLLPGGSYNTLLGSDIQWSAVTRYGVADTYIYRDPINYVPVFRKHLCIRYSGEEYAVYLVNVHFPDTTDDIPTITYYAPSSDAPVYLQYRLDLQVVGDNGSVVSGASVVIKNALGETVYSGTTNGDGRIPTQTLTRAKIVRAYVPNGPAQTVWHTPHTITISADGYFGETITLTMDNDVEYTAVLKAVEYQEVPVYTPVSEIACTVDAAQEIICTVQAEDTITCEVDA